jgi:hypothetical protein
MAIEGTGTAAPEALREPIEAVHLAEEAVRLANNQALGGRGGDHNGTFSAGDGGSAVGGGLYATGGSLDISDSMITSNQTTGGQGGDGTSSGEDGGAGGSGVGGGLCVNGGPLTIEASTIASNQGIGGEPGLYGPFGAPYSSGGGLVNGGTLTLSNSTLSGNHAYGTGGGGGIYNFGTLTVSNSTVSGNSVFDQGGGIYNYGTLTLSNSTLSGNIAGIFGVFGGGGIYNIGTLTVSNSTLSGNSAVDGGGGIATGGTPHPVTLTNVTITANRASSTTPGGGLLVFNGSPVLHNTLIAGNFRGPTGTTRDDVSGALNSGGDYNLIGDGTRMTGLTNGVHGNLVGSAAAPIDPLLGPLQDNGGPINTHALLAGSPALNAGDPAQLGVADQRGVLRSGGVNIGAYQASASAFVVSAPATVTAGTPFDLTVTAVDSFGQTSLGYTGRVTFTSADPYGATLPADYTFAAADHGVHLFPGGATLYTAGTWDVTATDTVTASLTGSATVSVNPAAADHLLFLQQPTDTPAGQTISPVVVEVVDAFGNVETGDDSDTITLSLGVNPGGGTLSGTLTVTVSGGIATFSDLAIDVVGDGYTLHAMATGLTDADSAAFRIT